MHALLMLLVSTSTGTATERPPTNWAVGVEGSLADPISVGDTVSLPTLTLVHAGTTWGLRGAIGTAWTRTTTEAPVVSTRSTTDVEGSLSGMYWPWTYAAGRLGFGLGAGFRGRFGGRDAEGETDRLRRYEGFAIAFVRPEWFVTPAVSVHTQVGVVYRFATDNTDDTRQSLALSADLLGQAGLSFWF